MRCIQHHIYLSGEFILGILVYITKFSNNKPEIKLLQFVHLFRLCIIITFITHFQINAQTRQTDKAIES